MKKLLFFVAIIFILNSCSNNPRTFEEYKRQYSHYKYHSLTINTVRGSEHASASNVSQQDANKNALEYCAEQNVSLKQHCVLSKEGDFDVLKIQIKKNEEKQMQNIITKNRNICKDIGYIDETEGMADCILKLSIEDKELLEEETKQTKQKQILQDQIDRQNQINNSQAVDQFLIDLSNILTGTQPQSTRTTPSGMLCNLGSRKIVSNAKYCRYYCPTGNYVMQLRVHELCPQQVRR